MAEERRVRHSLRRRITLSTLLIFLASIWALSYYASRMLREDMERMLADQQSSTVSYVAGELNDAFEDRVLVLEAQAGFSWYGHLDQFPWRGSAVIGRPHSGVRLAGGTVVVQWYR